MDVKKEMPLVFSKFFLYHLRKKTTPHKEIVLGGKHTGSSTYYLFEWGGFNIHMLRKR